MAECDPAVKSIGSLIEWARLHPGATLGAAMHQAYPIPMKDSQGLRVAFLYCRAEVVKPGEGLQLWPPSYVAFLDAFNGRFLSLRTATPVEFGQTDVPDAPIGSYRVPFERAFPEFLNHQARLYQAYDLLLPLFVKGNITEGEGIHDLAREFQDNFGQVSELPLRPYYKSFGQEFFSLLGPYSSSTTPGAIGGERKSAERSVS